MTDFEPKGPRPSFEQIPGAAPMWEPSEPRRDSLLEPADPGITGRAARREARRRRRGKRLIVLGIALVVGVVLWIWVFPWVDRTFVNRPQVGF